MPSKIDHGFEVVSIQTADGSSTASFVPQRGGVLSSLVMQGAQGSRELLFQHDYFWDEHIDDLPGGMPFCFPVFARLERQGKRGCYLYQGKRYQLPIHGFAWQAQWRYELVSDSHLRLSLTDNANTRQQYPFRFSVVLDYKIGNNQLLCQQTYSNPGAESMPYCAGFHPYFLTPEPEQGKQQVYLDYQPTARYCYNEALTDLLGEGELFHLPASVQDPAINEQLTAVGANKAIKLYLSDQDLLQLCAEGVEDEQLFPYVQLYTMPDRPFFCAEPIMAPPNALNTVSGMRWLKPGQSEHGLFKLWLTRK